MAEPFAHPRLEAGSASRPGTSTGSTPRWPRSRSRLIEARDVSRRQVAGRIRAEVVDQLLPLGEALAQVAAAAPEDPAAAATTVDRAQAVVGAAIEQLRQITSTVYSRSLSDQGLAAALRGEGRDGLRLTVLGEPRWSTAVESVLFAACTDLFRPLSGEVGIRLAEVGQQAEVELTLPSAPDPHRLVGVRERIEVLGGDVREGARGVTIRLPLIETAAGAVSVSGT